jgi:hypothetical protein
MGCASASKRQKSNKSGARRKNMDSENMAATWNRGRAKNNMYRGWLARGQMVARDMFAAGARDKITRTRQAAAAKVDARIAFRE